MLRVCFPLDLVQEKFIRLQKIQACAAVCEKNQKMLCLSHHNHWVWPALMLSRPTILLLSCQKVSNLGSSPLVLYGLRALSHLMLLKMQRRIVLMHEQYIGLKPPKQQWSTFFLTKGIWWRLGMVINLPKKYCRLLLGMWMIFTPWQLYPYTCKGGGN